MSDRLQVAEVPGDVASVVQSITAQLDARSIAVFATIDHAAGARAVGLQLADEVLLIFGNPAVGTALMQADSRSGYDLPLRMLVWSHGGTTRVGYVDPVALSQRYDLGPEVATLRQLRGLLEQVVAGLVGADRRTGERK